MTKEEIIDFCEMKAELEPENEDLYNYIIKVLKQETCEDCISRKAVLDMSDFVGEMPTYSHPYGRNLKEVVYVEDIESLPFVKPVYKKGKWTNGDPICPCCGEDKFKDLDADIWSDWQPKYCPNCGSFMEVDK